MNLTWSLVVNKICVHCHVLSWRLAGEPPWVLWAEEYKWWLLSSQWGKLFLPWFERQSLSLGRFLGCPSCWGCQRQREERPQLKLYCQWRCQHSKLPDKDCYWWCFKAGRLQMETSSPAGRLQGFFSIKSRLVPTQREGILNKQAMQGFLSVFD